MQIIAQTPRLTICNFLPGEENLYLNMFTDERVTKYLPQRTKKERQGLFKRMVLDAKAGELLNNWAVYTDLDKAPIGMILLRPYKEDPEKIEVGYTMQYDAWGKGLGTEMTTAMINYAFEKTNINTVIAITILENLASQKVLEKSGMTRQPNIFHEGTELAYFEITRV